jgi:peptide/nickel transport system permease protein
LATGLLGRYAPGALVDERELDPRLSSETIAALRAEREAEYDLVPSLGRYLTGLSHGDLGYSESRQAPIAELLAQGAPVTIRELAYGLLAGWGVGLGIAIPVARFRRWWLLDGTTQVGAGALLSVPAALLAFLCLTAGLPVDLVVMLALAPRIFHFSRNVLAQAYAAGHVDMARSRGIGEARILAAHVMPAAAPQLAALGAASFAMAIGTIIPIEAICDVPGLGRLAWQAAMARDLPLLVNLTMVIALVTVLATGLSERLRGAAA